MSYYTNNVLAFLHMGTSTATPLPSDATDTFTEVGYVQTLTPAAREKSVGFFNILNDANKRSVPGKLSDQNVPFTYVRDKTLPTHQAIESDASASISPKRNWRLVWPDGTIEKFVAFVSKWNPEAFDATGDAKEHIIDSNLAVDGAITIT